MPDPDDIPEADEMRGRDRYIRQFLTRWRGHLDSLEAAQPYVHAMRDVDVDVLEAGVCQLTEPDRRAIPTVGAVRSTLFDVALRRAGTMDAARAFDVAYDAVARAVPGAGFEWPDTVPAWARALWTKAGMFETARSRPREDARAIWLRAARAWFAERRDAWNGRQDTATLAPEHQQGVLVFGGAP